MNKNKPKKSRQSSKKLAKNQDSSEEEENKKEILAEQYQEGKLKVKIFVFDLLLSCLLGFKFVWTRLTFMNC